MKVRIGISLWCLLAIGSPAMLTAQSGLADSLAKVLVTAPPDTHRVSLLVDYAWEITDSETEKAAASLKEAIDLAQKLSFPKGEAAAWNALGVTSEIQDSLTKAIEYYNKALELDPANAEIYNNRSLIYKELGKPDRAVRGFLKAIQLDPGYVKAYNNIGLLYYEKHNLAAAVSSFEKAISIDPRNLESYNNLAIVYKKQNNLPKARQLYQTILKKNPGHVEAHYNLALLYEEEGDYTKAVEHYQSFVDLGQTQRPELVSRVRKHLELLR